ncbi:MAG: hypothetical protein R2682_00595 [Pyrinomonadaceae bacterium]
MKVIFIYQVSLRFAVLLLGILILAVIPVFGQTDTVLIVGRVVDSLGRPVPNPEVYLFPEGDRGGGPWPTAAAGDWGEFNYRLSVRAAKSANWRIYVGYHDCRNGASVLSPPFDFLREADSRFAGVPVPITDEKTIRLGDVKVQYRYASATLDLSELRSGAASLHWKDIPWEDLFLQVRTASGKRISLGTFGAMSIKAFADRRRSTIDIEIPEGSWGFDVVVKNNEKDPTAELVVASSPVVEIKDGQARPLVHFQRLKTPIQQYDGLRRDLP